MTTEFRIVGLQRLNNEEVICATLELFNNERTFKALVDAEIDRKEAMWNYCKGDWADKKIAEVRHDGFTNDSYPINPVVISIRHER